MAVTPAADLLTLPLDLQNVTVDPEVGPQPLPAGTSGLRVAGLFAGIGGIELGLHRAGHSTQLLCELEAAAQRVLRHHFPDTPLEPDVRQLADLPSVDVVAAGFPCQDLSQAGRTAGIRGRQSGLVDHVFRHVRPRGGAPTWLLIENVSFMLHLDRGRAMAHLVKVLEDDLGMTWAYRVVDTQAFLPQRRQRVILLASRTEDPRAVLFADEATEAPPTERPGTACGFYWTEGRGGLGWAPDAVPTLKGGSTLGIPSAPGIWMPGEGIVTPDIRDGERLQGFQADWTAPAVDDPTKRNGPRWKLVGNAVSVPVAAWVGRRLSDPGTYDQTREARLVRTAPWPTAAWGRKGSRHRVQISRWPTAPRYEHLRDFLQHETQLLSERATAGFLSRAKASRLRFAPGFIEAVEEHLSRMQGLAKAS